VSELKILTEQELKKRLQAYIRHVRKAFIPKENSEDEYVHVRKRWDLDTELRELFQDWEDSEKLKHYEKTKRKTATRS
jgi:hypothetical protein